MFAVYVSSAGKGHNCSVLDTMAYRPQRWLIVEPVTQLRHCTLSDYAKTRANLHLAAALLPGHRQCDLPVARH